MTDCCEDSSPEEPSSCSIDEAHLSNSIDADVQSGDFGRIVKLMSSRQLTSDEKYYLLKHHFIPDKTYNFPIHSIGDHNRKFQTKWLDEYNGLVYSVSDDGGYCKFCVLFGNVDSAKELSILVKRPLKNFKNAKEKLNDHCGGELVAATRIRDAHRMAERIMSSLPSRGRSTTQREF